MVVPVVEPPMVGLETTAGGAVEAVVPEVWRLMDETGGIDGVGAGPTGGAGAVPSVDEELTGAWICPSAIIDTIMTWLVEVAAGRVGAWIWPSDICETGAWI